MFCVSRIELKGLATMFFNSSTPCSEIQRWISVQLPAVVSAAKNGVDVDIRPHKTQRSNQQNRFLMAIMVALVRFYHETGFLPSGLSPWAMRTDILKEYWKSRLGVVSTSKLDTSAFGRFIDGIQRILVEETSGEWEILQPDSAYIKSLMADGGF